MFSRLRRRITLEQYSTVFPYPVQRRHSMRGKRFPFVHTPVWHTDRPASYEQRAKHKTAAALLLKKTGRAGQQPPALFHIQHPFIVMGNQLQKTQQK